MTTISELKKRLVNGHVLTEQDLHDIIDLAGTKGDKGETGAKGSKGAKGDPGKDGFPTKEDWDALVSRVEKLES